MLLVSGCGRLNFPTPDEERNIIMAPELTVATMPIHTQSTEHQENKTKKQKVAAEAAAEESEDGASAAAAPPMKLICTICLDEADGSSDVTTQCGHTFHRDCLQSWLDVGSSCPVCKRHLNRRRELNSSKLLSLA